MTHDYDAIVVGVGAMGSAATYHLARRGVDVLGLEQFDVPHAHGSSHGVTRIIRKAYYEHPDYVPLLERAYENWHDLDAGYPTDLLHTTGCVVAGPPGNDKVAGALESCREHDLAHEVVSGADLSGRYPGYEIPDDYQAVVEPEGGFLHCEQCVVAHVEAAHAEGATVRAREPVADWEPTPDGGVRVETEKGAYTADSLVVAAGAWARELVPELQGLAEPERQVLGWFQPDHPEQFDPADFPVFGLTCPEGYFYGFPRYGVPGFKIGKYNHRNEQVDPDRVAEPTAADERVLRECVERYFPDADGPTMRLETCLFTNSPDEDFVVDFHPEHPQVVLAAGFSGHGFKLSSAIGELLADLAVDGESDLPRDLFRLDRFR
jgi:sarcosine oxidase